MTYGIELGGDSSSLLVAPVSCLLDSIIWV